MKSPSRKQMLAASGPQGASRPGEVPPEVSTQEVPPLPAVLTRVIEPSELDALHALRATLGPEVFWHPKTLNLLRAEALDLYIDRQFGAGDPQVSKIIDQARGLRGLSAWDRILAFTAATWEKLQMEYQLPQDSELARAIAWSAHLPFPFWGWAGRSEFTEHRCSWLPPDLTVPMSADFQGAPIEETPRNLEVQGWLDLTGCTSLREIRPGLRVARNLILTDCFALQTIPEGVSVGGDLWISRSGALSDMTEEAIRSVWDIHGAVLGSVYGRPGG